ncbi:MAG: serine/threonine-protein phosphatase [Acidobacteriia bacterium]|nr:serine/threonine-protein phosphatase [Terriglobia bacterium]
MTSTTILQELEGLSSGCLCEEYKREARSIQCSLLPTRNLTAGSVEVVFRYTPFAEVGGDFADFFVLPDGVIGLYVGDVVGKGLPGALYAGLVMGIIRGIHKTGVDTASMLALLNDRLLMRPVPGRFCATLYAQFDPFTQQLTFSNAGVPFPLLASKTGCRPLGQGGFPSGMFPGVSYDLHTVQLSAGDSVLFATDGLHELCNQEGAELSPAKLSEIWSQCGAKSATQSLQFLCDAVSAFSGSRGPQDDVTAIVLKIVANPSDQRPGN